MVVELALISGPWSSLFSEIVDRGVSPHSQVAAIERDAGPAANVLLLNSHKGETGGRGQRVFGKPRD